MTLNRSASASAPSKRPGSNTIACARRPARGGPEGLGDAGVLGGIAALEGAGRRLREADVRRVEVEGVDRAVAALGDLRVAGRGQLVDAVRAVDHPGALRAEEHQ